MNVLFCASECTPFIKVGGIADVVGSLPLALLKHNINVSLVLPLYKDIYDKISSNQLPVDLISTISINYNATRYEIKIFKNTGAFDTYFIYNDKFIANGGVYYNPLYMNSLEDETERFVFFSKAVVEVFLNSKSPFYPNVLHCHDWHTGIIPQLIEKKFKFKSENKPKVIFTIHNLGYQGFTAVDVARKLELSVIDDKTLKWDAQDDNLDLLLQGIVGSNYITAVSPKYAQEIQTAEYGEGLEDVLSSRSGVLKGILNGIDYNIFNPSKDKNLYDNYDTNSSNSRKLLNKTKFCSEHNLDVNRPMISIVSRLARQKGLDVVSNAIDKILNAGFSIVILGTGDPELEQILNSYNHNSNYSDKYKAFITFSNDLAMKIYAASDFILIPSRYEPCGLTQMIAMKYGTIPVVRATGGLDDTVKNNETGFKFSKCTPEDILNSLSEAKKLFENKDKLDKFIIVCMQQDFSWEESAKEYIKLYNDRT